MPHEDRREEKKTGRKWWFESFDNKLLDGSGGDRRKNLSSSDFLRLFSTLSSQASRASLYPSSSGFSPSFLGSRRQRTTTTASFSTFGRDSRPLVCLQRLRRAVALKRRVARDPRLVATNRETLFRARSRNDRSFLVSNFSDRELNGFSRKLEIVSIHEDGNICFK